MKFNCLARPHCPLAEEPSCKSPFHSATVDVESMRREKIEDDVIIVARVECDVIAAGFGNGADHIKCAVSIKGGDLDRDHRREFREAPPKRIRQHASAGRGLEIETEDGQHISDRPAMIEEFVIRRRGKCREA